MLPSFATSLIVVKDVHIIFISETEFDESHIKDLQSNSNPNKGILCVSISKSDNSTYHREGASIQSTKNRVSIKIPAPQILGWILELTPEDQTAKQYENLPAKEFESHIKPPHLQGNERART
ncbi:hypothetical protein TWF506_004798 [Arthrobotrys conoides]|uniref:Uncharacterized protein n=1 Tax=Arthrobotrys conoides TaxID=74498 RepID=A0AAN8NFD6_9PEZI